MNKKFKNWPITTLISLILLLGATNNTMAVSAPTAPTNVTCSLSGTTLSVNWDEPINSPVLIASYRIHIYNNSLLEEEAYVNEPTHTKELTNQSQIGNYEVHIRSISTNNMWSTSVIAPCNEITPTTPNSTLTPETTPTPLPTETPNSIPTPPTNVTCSLSGTTLSVNWDEPINSPVLIASYRIHIYNNSLLEEEAYVNEPTRSIIFTNQSPNGNYDVHIRSISTNNMWSTSVIAPCSESPTPTPSPTATPTVTPTLPPEGYKLVFNDEFDYPKNVDPISNSTFASKWFYTNSTCDYTAGIWPGNNVQTDGNGKLIFIVPGSNNGGGIMSSCDMKGKIREAFLYGYFEFRIKAPHTNQIPGIGWDIWLSGAYKWPPEIDLTESGSGPVNHYAGINQILSTLHWPYNQNEIDNYIYYDSKGNITTIPTNNPVDLSNDYHIYGLLWTPDYASLSLDGVQIAKWSSNIPQDYMYIVLSASNPGTVGLYPPEGSNIYPAFMYVDYIRVYQKI